MPPIKASEVTGKKRTQIPEEVFDAFNELIVENMHGKSSTFTQKKVVALILEKSILSRDVIFNKNYLDVEDIYRAEGWLVEYDSPGYCENYDATYTFRKRSL